ncbi:integrase, partial [Pseudomonas sp. 30_B]|uniref:integrase n=1 Tax=Pseudomonas sp. 30_B TaxID=2813575 RepID=UPI001A9CFD08
QNDPEIKHLIDRIQSGEEIENYEMFDNILYRKATPTSLLVIPNSLINVVLYNMHDHPMSGHGGKERTLKRIQGRFHFHNMKNIVNSYVESCSDCLTRKKVPGKQYGLMMPMNRNSPADKWGCDVLGPFNRSRNGNRDVIVAIDYYTRYAEIKAVPNGTTPKVTKFIIENIITRHGTPSMIVTDRGRAFI